MPAPKALHLAPIMPSRGGNGLAMRQGLFLEALARGFDTRLVVIPVAGPATGPADLPAELGIPVDVLPVAGRSDTHFAMLSRLADPAARLAAFRNYGRSSLAAGISVPVLDDLKALLGSQHFDLVHVGRSYLADAARVPDARLMTLDLDEDEKTSFDELSSRRRRADPVAADWLEAEGASLDALIGRSVRSFVRHFISGPDDAQAIGERHPGLRLEVVENAIALPTSPRVEPDPPPSLLFVGSYGYAPNVDAVTWFADAILPLLRRQSRYPVTLRIVGRDSGRVSALAARDGIAVDGEIDDISRAYARATVVVAPLRAGAGTRLKLMEAAANGAPIVATSIGNRGLPFVHGRHLLIADSATGFADAVVETLTDVDGRHQRAEAAFDLVRRRFDRAGAIERLACRLADIAAR